ncbi:SemiSWEET family sugar transporter [Spiroplasma clarkii]|uniref:MtN3 and saliva related transmembrane protein n=1 Tax=Spiroplasma clarkii TaxID=2139 RepID=A0A2K8KHG7_9MOLU|nr:SemiSWEET family transporter [Spiroplasma clarkii]ATX71133.1 hypothetical protein SCLAR_v1c08210 [Spiroplasma clarkii]
MSRLIVEIIGWISAGLTAIYLIPQIIRIIKTKNTSDISFYSLAILLSASVLWTIYGILLNTIQVYMTNISQASLVIMILTFKIVNTIKANKSQAPEVAS